MAPIISQLKSEPSLRTSLDRSLWDASFYSLMVGFGETYLAAFLLVLGFGQITSGLVTTLPVVAGSAMQLLISLVFRRVQNFRRWVVICAKLQALSLFLLALSPLGLFFFQSDEGSFPPHMLPALFLLAALYWTAGLSAGPAWNAWMGALVPPSLRITFFSKRSRIAQAFTLIGVVAGGFLLQYLPPFLSYLDGTPNPHENHSNMATYQMMTFSILLTVAGFSRMGSAFFISRQRDETEQRIKPIYKRDFSFFKDLKSKKLGTLLTYMFCLQVAVYIAAPFFSPFMLKQLNLSYVEYTLLTSTTFLTRIILFPWFSRLADSKGPLPLVAIGTCFVAVTPFLWTFSDSVGYIFFLQIISGAGWGLQEMGVFLLLLDRYPSAERSSVLTAANFLGSVGMLIGSAIGTVLLKNSGLSIESYYALFLTSTVARVCAALFIPYLSFEKGPRRYAMIFRVIGLRPNMGAIVRPILYLRRRNAKPRQE